jgi:twitching motility protein PilT
MDTFAQILRGAIAAGASDVHIKADRPVIFRIQRDLCPVDSPAPTESWIKSIIGEIVPPHLRERLDAEREIDFAFPLAGVGRFRVNIYQQRGRFGLALRVVRMEIRTFDELHLPPIVRRIAESPRGIILIAGAPGSGKSTTLAALIDHVNRRSRKHIVTLEDPIEYFFEDHLAIIEQREVGLDTPTFASGLHNVLRQDPDVLVIGEMRGLDAVMTAVSSANVGTLVVSTLHTSDAARSIQRILDFYPAEEREHARQQLATTLGAVLCQKLVRTKQGTIIPAVEVLINTSGVAKLIESNKLDQLNAAIELGSGDGMQTFTQSLLDLLKDGKITQAEALASAPNADTMKMRLQGVVLTDHRRILGAR